MNKVESFRNLINGVRKTTLLKEGITVIPPLGAIEWYKEKGEKFLKPLIVELSSKLKIDKNLILALAANGENGKLNQFSVSVQIKNPTSSWKDLNYGGNTWLSRWDEDKGAIFTGSSFLPVKIGNDSDEFELKIKKEKNSIIDIMDKWKDKLNKSVIQDGDNAVIYASHCLSYKF